MERQDGPKISIIVPIYNVEPYLRKCLDSIAGQTYQNLEVILVDDGSPDRCPAVCDEYVANDPRFKVIHKANGGRASARNAGLDAATGDWIGWVDPDDWVESDMFEYLLKGALEYGADIASCGYYRVGREGALTVKGPGERLLFDREEGLRDIIRREKQLCDKLWHRELWRNVRCPESQVYFEDIIFVLRAFERAERTVYLPEPKYYYLFNESSATASRSLKKRYDYYAAYRESYEHFRALRESGGEPQSGLSQQLKLELEAICSCRCVEKAADVWAAYLDEPRAVRQAMLPRLREISIFVKGRIETAVRETNMRCGGRIRMRLTAYPTWWSFWLARTVDRLYWWKQGRSGTPSMAFSGRRK